jgi:two-component system, NtrC family, sensor kinase
MKTLIIYIFGFLLGLLPYYSNAQKNPFWDVPTSLQAESLKQILEASNNDTLNMYLNRQIGLHYQELNRPVALARYKEMLVLAKKTNQQLWEAEAHSRVGYVSCLMQNYAGGLKSLILAKSMASEPRAENEMWNPGLLSQDSNPYIVRMTVMANITQHFGLVHYFAGEYSKALEYNQEVKNINEILNDDALRTTYFLNIAESLIELAQLDSAELALKNSLYYSDKSGYKKYKGLALYDIGRIHEKRINFEEAKKYYWISIKINIEEESPDFEGMGYQALSNLFIHTGNIDSAFFFSRKALNTYLIINDTLGLIAANASLSSAFDHSNIPDSALYYLKKSVTLKDGLNKEERIKNFKLTGLGEQFKLQELEAEQLRIKSNIRTYSFATGMIFLLFISGIIYRSYRRQKKDRHTIERAFADLKFTQAQLIQSEKMASLGELTAGIAHEIQNPLNFVNNFSEVSKELIGEMNEELAVGNNQLANEIAEDIKQNLEKINFHGKRAADIVKGMLQHSRTSSGQKEPTDVNALAGEFLRLAYHGLRTKDKSFNARMNTDFDETIGNINIIPQDIGRVILNLITNAFYVVDEKKKLLKDGYEPAVSVSTKKMNNQISISVKDNGNGIPKHILDKIFQPFFTTKPTGQGTGLGLSLSYDMVKAHGGGLKVETKEGEGSEFIIQLPIA